MKVRFKLKKAWSDADGNEYKAGRILECDDSAFVDQLVEDGIAELVKAAQAAKVAPVPSDDGTSPSDDGDNDSTKTSKSANDPNETVSMKRADLLALIDEARSTKGSKAGKRPDMKVTGERWEEDPACGYTPAEWYRDVVKAGTPDVAPPKKLIDANKHLTEIRAKALGSDEYASVQDSIGGFFIQPQFDDRFLTKGIEDDFVRANGAVVIPSDGNILKINAETDANRQTNLYGGIEVTFQGERQQIADSKGTFEQVTLEPRYLTGLYYITDHLLRNAPAMAAIVGRQFRDAFTRKETLSWLAGNGNGAPLGILSAPGRYTVPARQASNEIQHADLIAMRARCWDYDRAIWVAAFGTYEQIANSAKLHTIQNVAETENVGGSGQLTWQQQIQTDRPNILLGRPIVFTEYGSALGTEGDIMLVAWNHYLIAESGQFVNDSSIHVRFDSMETAFRFAKRIDGQPWWRSTLTTQNGYVMSPYVTLSAST